MRVTEGYMKKRTKGREKIGKMIGWEKYVSTLRPQIRPKILITRLSISKVTIIHLEKDSTWCRGETSGLKNNLQRGHNNNQSQIFKEAIDNHNIFFYKKIILIIRMSAKLK